MTNGGIGFLLLIAADSAGADLITRRGTGGIDGAPGAVAMLTGGLGFGDIAAGRTGFHHSDAGSTPPGAYVCGDIGMAAGGLADAGWNDHKILIKKIQCLGVFLQRGCALGVIVGVIN